MNGITKKTEVVCQQCKGSGHVSMVLKDRSGKQPDGCGVLHNYVMCPQTGCHNGIVDMEEYYDSWQLTK